MQVVALLDSGDLDCKVNCLTLINVLMKKADTKIKLQALLTALDGAVRAASSARCDHR